MFKQSRHQNLRQWLEYVLKYETIDAIFDAKQFAMSGFPLVEIRTLLGLKKFYVSGKLSKQSKTEQVLEMIQSGMTNQDIKRQHGSFYFHQCNKIIQSRIHHQQHQTFPFVRPTPIDLTALTDVHASGMACLRWWNKGPCADPATYSKGDSWLNLRGISNIGKSSFVRRTFCDILTVAQIVFAKGWSQGFTENGQQVMYVDGVTSETMRNGFSAQCMEHATVGHDDFFLFPVKYAIDAPRTHGELMVTTTNLKLKEIVGEVTWETIVKERVCEIEIRAETDIYRIANIIRRSCNLPSLPPPIVTSPDGYSFSQSQAQ